ncbi:hypothetical protein N0V93_005406 [Gnomoniopsis smithogilvyi]|uniref:Uncharacterized protein n=1 Tax=Gnomoniopsis smithogilvyi TaxID=1191159 RepID=A0A9W8YUE6_9PEZI|nr:hypothetical protein N0V93_005406 [Gnomoniopsis smithogilvyi]
MNTGILGQSRQGSSATHNTIENEKIVHTATVNPRRSKTQRFRKHFANHKCIYLGVGLVLVLLAVLLPILFTVVVRHMILNAINDADMPLLSGSVEAVNSTHVRFGLTSELRNNQDRGVTLEAFPLELYNPESESKDTIVSLNFPEQYLEKKSLTSINVAPQTLEIQSQVELRRFLAKAFSANQTTVGVRGNTYAHVLGSHSITIDKEISLDGLRNLEGMKVDTLVPAPPGGFGAKIAVDDPRDSIATMNGSLTIPNPSKLSLALGDVTYNVYSAGVLLGESHVNDLRLVPGQQAIPYEGTLNIDTIIDKANKYANFKKIMEGATDDARVPFDIVGNSTSVNGEHIEYLDEVLGQIKLRVAPCATVTQDAIPQNKMYFALRDLLPTDEDQALCDKDAPVS